MALSFPGLRTKRGLGLIPEPGGSSEGEKGLGRGGRKGHWWKIVQPPAGVLGCPHSWLFLTLAAFLPACYCMCVKHLHSVRGNHLLQWKTTSSFPTSARSAQGWGHGEEEAGEFLPGLENKIQLSSCYWIPAVAAPVGQTARGSVELCRGRHSISLDC